MLHFIFISRSNVFVSLSIIIPIYNEESNLSKLTELISNNLDMIDYEIIFVDDGSNDNTSILISQLKRKYPIKLIQRSKKLGLSSAVITGLDFSTKKFVCVMDGDLQHNPKYIPEMLDFITEDNNSLIIGSRFIKRINNKQRLDSKVGTFFCKLFFNKKVEDPLSGFFMLSTSNFKSLKDKINAIGYKILLELIVKGQFSKINEIPIIFDEREGGKSKLDFKTRAIFLKQLFLLFFNK
jgi:dolichol-phosphate mannosyltransferase